MIKLYYTLAIIFGMGIIASCGNANDESAAEATPTEEVAATDEAQAADASESDSTTVEAAEEK